MPSSPSPVPSSVAAKEVETLSSLTAAVAGLKAVSCKPRQRKWTSVHQAAHKDPTHQNTATSHLNLWISRLAYDKGPDSLRLLAGFPPEEVKSETFPGFRTKQSQRALSQNHLVSAKKYQKILSAPCLCDSDFWVSNHTGISPFHPELCAQSSAAKATVHKPNHT